MKTPANLSTNSSANGGRLVILDQLRGLCLAIIIIDHINLFPAVLEWVTGRGLLWTTAAEGFFFISGLMVGLVRGRQALGNGFALARRKLLSRAAQLYVASVVLTFGYTLLVYWLNHKGIGGSKHGIVYFDNAWELIGRTLSQLYVYGWSDFLAYYVVYLLLAPVALWLLLRGRWRWVMALSLAAWILPWVWPGIPIPFGIRWQFYFFGGLTVGFYYDTIRRWWAGRSAFTRRRLTVDAAVIAGIGLAAGAVVMIWPLWWGGTHNNFLDTLRWIAGTDLYQDLFQRDRTGILRPAFFVAFFATLYLVFQRYQAQIHRWTGWLLEPLGANSLYVYIMHGPLVFLLPFVGLGAPADYWINTLVPLGVILAVWYLVKRRFLFRIVPR